MSATPPKLSDQKYCKDCGSMIDARAEICPHCGVRQMQVPASGGKSRIAAALLAFFLGGFGAHKFYLGQVGLGILYVIFCWTFVPAIVAFIEFILYLVMSDDAFDRKYNQA